MDLRSALRWIFTTITGIAVAAILGQFAIEYADEWGVFHNEKGRVSTLIHSQIFLTTIIVLGSFAVGLWIDAILGKPKPVLGYVETMVRFERDRSAAHLFKEAAAANIFSTWQIWNFKPALMVRYHFDKPAEMKAAIPDVYPAVPEKSPQGPEPEQLDTFFIVFDKPTKYDDIELNSFGHAFPKYEWHNATERGAILFAKEPIAAPTFEIRFVRKS